MFIGHTICIATYRCITTTAKFPTLVFNLEDLEDNRWKRITGAQLTRCGHRRRIVRCGGRYGPRWSGAAVSE